MATATSSSSKGQLHVLRDSVDTSQDGVDIVLCPWNWNYLPVPVKWPFANQKWLDTLPGSSAGVHTLAYEYASAFAGTNKPSWESILMLGCVLPRHLSEARSQSAPVLTTKKPILIVCYSLGDIVVKQALCIATKQFPRYGSVVNAIAGVIFLSIPYRYGDKTTSLAGFRDVLGITTGKNLKISNANIEQEGAILLNLADRFEGISFRTPILSVYELRESKNSSTPLRHKYQQLVNRKACSTYAPMETVIGLNLTYYDICLFTKSVGGKGLPEFNKFIYETLYNAMHLVAFRFQNKEYQYAIINAYLPTICEIPLNVEQLEPTEWLSNKATKWPSNRATDGKSLSGFEVYILQQ